MKTIFMLFVPALAGMSLTLLAAGCASDKKHDHSKMKGDSAMCECCGSGCPMSAKCGDACSCTCCAHTDADKSKMQ